jgi:hypothetical protein
MNSKVSLTKLNKLQDYFDSDKTVHHADYNSAPLKTPNSIVPQNTSNKKPIFFDCTENANSISRTSSKASVKLPFNNA